MLRTNYLAAACSNAFIKIGYHPIAGLTMAYASAVGGFAANIVVGMQDALVYSFTEPATGLVSDSIKTNVAMNWYFIAASVVVLLPTILLVTTKLIIPRLGKYDDSLMHDDHEETSSHITDKEAHALKWANMIIVTIILLIITAIPEHSFLRNAKTGSLLDDAPLIERYLSKLSLSYF
ncbi:AbgT family transporter [Staphylococcus aureus]